jgi:uncharacterized protein
MTRGKKMTTLIIGIILILFVIGIGIWWFTFFSRPNPPLPRQQVTIISSSSPTSANTTTTASSTNMTSTTTDADANIDENPPLPTEKLTIDNAVFDVEIASTMLEQSRGLSNRPSLGVNDGMLFVFGSPGVQTFWMKDMNFALDMIWISDGKVVGFAQNAPPPAPGTQLWQLQLYSSPPNVDTVLEVDAGTVARDNIQIGDAVSGAGQ